MCQVGSVMGPHTGGTLILMKRADSPVLLEITETDSGSRQPPGRAVDLDERSA